MKGKKIILWAPVLVFVAALSVKPFLFTANFFLYLMNQTGGNTVRADKYLVNAIRVNPGAYRSLIRLDRADLLLAAAFIAGEPELLESLTGRDRKKMMPVLRKLKGADFLRHSEVLDKYLSARGNRRLVKLIRDHTLKQKKSSKRPGQRECP